MALPATRTQAAHVLLADTTLDATQSTAHAGGGVPLALKGSPSRHIDALGGARKARDTATDGASDPKRHDVASLPAHLPSLTWNVSHQDSRVSLQSKMSLLTLEPVRASRITGWLFAAVAAFLAAGVAWALVHRKRSRQMQESSESEPVKPVGLMVESVGPVTSDAPVKPAKPAEPADSGPSKKVETAKKPKLRIGWFDHAKLLAMVGVSVLHCCQQLNAKVIPYGVRMYAQNEMPASLNAMVELSEDVCMPIFFIVAGAVSRAEQNSNSLRQGVVRLLLPVLLVAFWLDPIDSVLSSFAGQLELPDWKGLSTIAFLLAGFTHTTYGVAADSAGHPHTRWFLVSLFFLRAVILPMLGNVETRLMIVYLIAGYVAYLMLTTQEIWHPGDPFYEATQYTPYYMMGFLCARHKLIDRFISFASEAPRAYLAVRLVSVSLFVGSWLLAMVGGKTIPMLAGVARDGCIDQESKMNYLPLWDRFSPLGCIAADRALQIPMILVWLLWLPLQSKPFFTGAGANTLGAYLLQGYVSALCFASALAIAEATGFTIFPEWLVPLIGLFAPLFATLLFCSEPVAFAFWPLLNPSGWGAMKLLDCKAPTAEPPVTLAQVGLVAWFLFFVGCLCLCAAAQAGMLVS